MFTGLIRARGEVISATATPTGRRLVVRITDGASSLLPAAIGDSIAVNGCCLTLVEICGEVLHFDVIPQTEAITTLASWSPSRPVHLESALRVGQPLGGHLVQGHVDGVARVTFAGERDGYRVILEVARQQARWLLEHGSIAIDGVSLTLAAIDRAQHRCEVALIPETLRATDLGALRAGDFVNVEFDQMAKAIAARLDGAITPSASE